MRKLLLNPFQNVGAGQVAVIPNIALGETYHGIILELGGTFTKADIDLIKIRLGGKLIWEVTGSELDTINQFLGMTANAGFLLIPFSEFNARTILGEAIGAIDTSLGYSAFSIEVTINAAAVNPTLSAYGLTTPVKLVQNQSHGPLIKAMIKSTQTLGAAGKYSLQVPIGSKLGALIKRLHMFHANMTQFDVKMNGIDLQDTGVLTLEQFWQNNLTRVSQAGLYTWDPIVRDNQSEAVPTVQDLNGQQLANNFIFAATVSAADTITSLSELYTTVDAV